MKILALDLETTGLNFSSDVISIAVTANFGGNETPLVKSWLATGGDLFQKPTPIPVIVHELSCLIDQADIVALHNASFDLSFLFGKGLLRPEKIKGKIFDTLLTARMTGPRDSVSLESLCNHYKLSNDRWKRMKASRSNLRHLSVESVLEYNTLDAVNTLNLAEILWKESVAIYGESFTLRESDFCRVMAEIRVRGKALDRDSIASYEQRLLRQRRRILKYILFPVRIEGPNDRMGLIRHLKTHGFRDFKRTEKGNESVAKDELRAIITRLETTKREDLAMVCRAIQSVRHSEKILDTYLLPLVKEHADAEDRIHPSFTVGGTVTYRLSSSHPNGQNMPRELAHVLWQPYLSADYSQAELRLAAAYAQEPALAQAFAEGLDVHLDTAKRMFGEAQAAVKRSTAKNINFLSLYGGGAKTLSTRFNVPFDDATEFLRLHRQVYPHLHRATKTAQATWQERGYVKLLSGKRIYATKDDLQRSYKAFNNIIQGGVAELVKEAMLTLDGMGIPMLGQEHDAISFPIEVEREPIAEVMNAILPAHIATRTIPPIQMRVDFDVKGTKSRG